MLFPYLHQTCFDHTTVFFHPLTFDVLFFEGQPDQAAVEEAAVKAGLAKHWVVGEDFSYDAYIDAFLSDSTFAQVDIRTLKMFTTTMCNLNCSYCLIEKNLEKRGCSCKNLSAEDAMQVIDRFGRLCRSQKRAKRTIMLYGGEPLMNRDTVFGIIRRIRHLEKEDAFNGQVEIDLECNGTLVTKKDALFLKEHNVFVLISIDGIRKVHDTYRRTKAGDGSYDAARAGYETLIQNGCTAVISSVFTDLYAENLDACLDAATGDLKPKSIGLNLLHVLEDQTIAGDKTLSRLDRYIRAFEKAREKGLYIEHIMRRIRPLTDRKVRISDCGACGNRIVSDVDGRIGICEGLVGNPDYFFRREDYAEVKQDPEFLRWARRTPLKMECCIGCRAMGICGGGCVSNALQQNKELYSPDRYICESSMAFTDWALKEWWKIVQPVMEAGAEQVHLLTDSERNRLLGSLRKSFDIPLQTVSRQFEKSFENA